MIVELIPAAAEHVILDEIQHKVLTVLTNKPARANRSVLMMLFKLIFKWIVEPVGAK